MVQFSKNPRLGLFAFALILQSNGGPLMDNLSRGQATGGKPPLSTTRYSTTLRPCRDKLNAQF
jgi:hypothetical protein